MQDNSFCCLREVRFQVIRRSLGVTRAREGRAMTESGNLDLRSAAQRLGVSPYTLRRWALYQHRLPLVRLGRRLLFRPRDLEAVEQAHLITAAGTTRR